MPKKFKTKDLYEASCLFAKKQRLVSLEKDTGFCWFVFDDWDSSSKISDSFWRNELTVSAKDYADAIRTLKDRIFARN